MPQRKRYYVTDHGKTALVEASKSSLSGLEWYYLDLNVGLEASDLLTPEDIGNSLFKRLARVRSNKKRLKELYATENDKQFKKKAVIKNLIKFREAEEMFLQECIQELSSTVID